MSVQFSVFDTETTGLDPASGARVIEIAVVRMDETGSVIRTWSTLVNPGSQDIGATEIHKITPAMVADAPTFEEIAGDFINAVAGSILVAHNAPFDIGMLKAEFGRAGLQWPAQHVADTLSGARKLVPGLRSYKLGALAEHFDITFDGDAHAALADTHVAAQLHAKLLERCSNVNWPDPNTVAWPVVIPSGKSHQRRQLVEATLF
jgi:DNA polymerase-3 subunit epsilon